MKRFSFYVNAIFTSIAILLVSLNVLDIYDAGDKLLLVFLAFYQVTLSMSLTIYSIGKNNYLLLLFIVYWILVILYFQLMFKVYFYACVLIALYNVYLNYCTFSNSKFNILKK
jgi:hypothetical protein